MAQRLNLDDLILMSSLDVNLPIITIFCSFFIDDIIVAYTFITIHELKPWVLYALKSAASCMTATFVNEYRAITIYALIPANLMDLTEAYFDQIKTFFICWEDNIQQFVHYARAAILSYDFSI